MVPLVPGLVIGRPKFLLDSPYLGSQLLAKGFTLRFGKLGYLGWLSGRLWANPVLGLTFFRVPFGTLWGLGWIGQLRNPKFPILNPRWLGGFSKVLVFSFPDSLPILGY